MDTPYSLDNAASDAFDQTEPLEVENLKPAAPKAQEVKTEPEAPQVDAPEVVEEESFTKINPNELSEELKPFYKSMQADYTRKRQAERAELKKAQEELASLRETAPQKPEEGKTKELSTEELVRKVAHETFIEEQESTWDKSALAEYPTIDDRLNEDNPVEYDSLMDDFVRTKLTDALQEHYNENGTKLGFNYKQVAKEAIEEWEDYITNAVKKNIVKQNQVIKQKVDSSKKMTPHTVRGDVTKSSKMSLDDAAAGV